MRALVCRLALGRRWIDRIDRSLRASLLSPSFGRRWIDPIDRSLRASLLSPSLSLSSSASSSSRSTAAKACRARRPPCSAAPRASMRAWWRLVARLSSRRRARGGGGGGGVVVARRRCWARPPNGPRDASSRRVTTGACVSSPPAGPTKTTKRRPVHPRAARGGRCFFDTYNSLAVNQYQHQHHHQVLPTYLRERAHHANQGQDRLRARPAAGRRPDRARGARDGRVERRGACCCARRASLVALVARREIDPPGVRPPTSGAPLTSP